MDTLRELIADPQTPEWIKASVQRLQKQEPSYAALLEAVHDRRNAAAAEAFHASVRVHSFNEGSAS